MFTIEDLRNQVTIQGDVIIKDIDSGDVVYEGDESWMPDNYMDSEIWYIYPEDNKVVYEVRASWNQ